MAEIATPSPIVRVLGSSWRAGIGTRIGPGTTAGNKTKGRKHPCLYCILHPRCNGSFLYFPLKNSHKLNSLRKRCIFLNFESSSSSHFV